MNAAIDLLTSRPSQPLSASEPQPLVSNNEPQLEPLDSRNKQKIHPIHPGIVIGEAPPIESELIAANEPDVADMPEGETRFSRLRLVSSETETKPRYVDMDVEGGGEDGRIRFSLNDEAAFIEFWGFTFWKYAPKVAEFFLKVNGDSLRTEEDDAEMARDAAKALFQMSKDNPKLLGWMRAEVNAKGGEWLVVFMFFSGKFGPIGKQLIEKRAQGKKGPQNSSGGASHD